MNKLIIENNYDEKGYLGCITCLKPVSSKRKCECKLRVIALIMKKDPNRIYYEPIKRY